MNWEVLGTIIAAAGGLTALLELIKYIFTRKSEKRKAAALAKQASAEADDKCWEKYEHQLDRMNSQIEFKDKRIESLNEQIDQKEKRFEDQTKRLRESQDRESKSQQLINALNDNINSLQRKNCDLELSLKDLQCKHLTCLDREPKNEHTKRAEANARGGCPVIVLQQTKHVSGKKPRKKKAEVKEEPKPEEEPETETE